jgi:hypothetical protein
VFVVFGPAEPRPLVTAMSSNAAGQANIGHHVMGTMRHESPANQHSPAPGGEQRPENKLF